MKVNNTEAEVLKAILSKLKYNLNRDIIFHLRIHAGSQKLASGYQLALAPAGNPDLIIILQSKASLKVLFLEVKKPGVTKLRYEQQQFFSKMNDIKGVFCRVINDPKMLWKIIQEVQNEEIMDGGST